MEVLGADSGTLRHLWFKVSSFLTAEFGRVWIPCTPCSPGFIGLEFGILTAESAEDAEFGGIEIRVGRGSRA